MSGSARTWPRLARAVAAGALLLAAPPLFAQPLRDPVPSGAYEGYSPVLMAPVGPISADAARRLLPRWLEVTTSGRTCTVVMRPDGNVRWKLRYGPHGLIEKLVEIDGEAWLRSEFTYDGSGRLRQKAVSGAGAGKGLRFAYRTDERGRVLERTRAGSDEKLTGRHGTRETVVELQLGGQLVRRDVLDASGLLVRTEVGRPLDRALQLTLRYERGRDGRLLKVTRQLARGDQRPADFTAREPTVAPLFLKQLAGPIERHEVLLLLGAPVRHSVTGRGRARHTSDGYDPECWLNQPSALKFDAADLLVGTQTNCICGFCVDARTAVSAAEVLGRDEHWTRGPWVRLDGELDITADHRVLTPHGPRPAGALRAGDAVLAAGGGVRVLHSVRRLPPGPERLGVNLRSGDGTFAAAGILVESERPRPCRAR